MTVFVRAASGAEIEEGQMQCVEVHGQEILLARVKGEIYATEALCSHGQAYLDQGLLEGYELVCPLHDGCFDVRTGAPTKAPAAVPIKIYPIRIVDEDVHVGIDA
jgi:naphthalene 1,2-dioxygenase system ferredoxin subunit